MTGPVTAGRKFLTPICNVGSYKVLQIGYSLDSLSLSPVVVLKFTVMIAGRTPEIVPECQTR